MDITESKIKKATLIREFRKQIVDKSPNVVLALDKPFFEIINFVFKQKPHDVKFHITKTNDLVFNIKFSVSRNIEAYIEHFRDGDVQMTVAHDDQPDMLQGSLEYCLEMINLFLKLKEYDSNSTNA